MDGDRVEERQRMVEMEREQARYEALLASRRYESIDPHNRLVARELEARWNLALQKAALELAGEGLQAALCRHGRYRSCQSTQAGIGCCWLGYRCAVCFSCCWLGSRCALCSACRGRRTGRGDQRGRNSPDRNREAQPRESPTLTRPTHRHPSGGR
jgi:hypothetical protein